MRKESFGLGWIVCGIMALKRITKVRCYCCLEGEGKLQGGGRVGV